MPTSQHGRSRPSAAPAGEPANAPPSAAAPYPDDVLALLGAVFTASGAELVGPAGTTLASGPALLARARGLAQAFNAVSAELARTVRAADLAQACQVDGQPTMRSWLRGHLRYTPADAAALVNAGRLHDRLPRFGQAAADGQITPRQTDIVNREVKHEHWSRATAAGADVDGIDAELTHTAVHGEPGLLATQARQVKEWVDPDGNPPADPTALRRLTATRTEYGGRMTVELDHAGYEKASTALTSIQQAGRVKNDERDHAQQMGDAFVQLADLQLAAGDLPMLRKHRPQFTATIRLEDLLSPELLAGAAQCGSGQQVSNAVARAAACDSDITRVIFGPAGVPVDIGRAQRLVPAHIRRAAEARDGGCVFAGCNAPTWWCDAHHVAEWIADHGPTSVENTALLCERHHTQVHSGFSIEWDDDLQRWRTYRPDGTEILVVPLPKLTDLITAAETDGGSTFRIDFADNRAERLRSDPLLV